MSGLRREQAPRRAAALPARLDHHTLERYEGVWLVLALIMVILLFGGVLASFVSGTYPSLTGESGHHITGVENGRLDPRNFAGTPFATPGVRRNADGTYEGFVVARAFQFEPAVLKVPAGQPIVLHVTSADVLHGFFIEGTNINTTAIPGQVSSFTTTFQRPGLLHVICNEYCGAGHHNMMTRLVVEVAAP
ncbi:cytochrome C oxidase subunit II [Deinococcus irradiatisoli]|uniref:Cytochrome C oxidase subunit II n=1 Tax=Deinococcus irradiatisoli TaxID=2202254 RepID=A0A2Z3JL87_9DEIO|nr:cytochrome c oxidase subunit II [Deinococcus irradiatisoli]AWN24311.1 cytochrome C oxidase subunit II [Deinococcus irradiatisoli]